MAVLALLILTTGTLICVRRRWVGATDATGVS
ncbi:MAG: hypothetical protein ACYSVY_29560 [Planctomycetota bacterium]